jgi:hypothetical protein
MRYENRPLESQVSYALNLNQITFQGWVGDGKRIDLIFC